MSFIKGSNKNIQSRERYQKQEGRLGIILRVNFYHHSQVDVVQTQEHHHSQVEVVQAHEQLENRRGG
jgi:hypothetical protein